MVLDRQKESKAKVCCAFTVYLFFFSTKFVLGRYYFEATQTDANGITRIGWSIAGGQLDLGTDNQGFGYGGTGKKSYARQFDDYGETYGIDDVVGSLLDLDQMQIRYFKNGLFSNVYF